MPEINTSRPDPDPKEQIAQVFEGLFAKHHRNKCYPGLVFEQGKRKMVQINVPAHDLPTLLQAKPSTDNNPDSGKNRPEVKGHTQEIKDYILKRARKGKPWILGTLTANVARNEIDIIELGRGICLVVIPRGVKLDITDGQHRKRAIHELMEGQEAKYIADNDFPITLVLEGDFNQCQTDFRDMAQTEKLHKSLLLSFGEFEGRVGITKNLLERVGMFQGKTEKIKASPDTKKRLIYTTNYIARFVSCALGDDPNNELKDYDVDDTSEALVICLNQFFSECRDTRDIFETNVQELTVEEVAAFKENCILGWSVGLEILGRLLYCIYDKENNYFIDEKTSEIAQLDWAKKSHLWNGNVVLYNPNSENKNKSYKITANASGIRIAVNTAKAHLGWI
ncbi:DNA sulfur modification protein DndB [Aerosakkonema funiforme]|uniref:DNA sulfur modification protein DndB n=1 Tax=Aerosakkonema funiforme FACHB-1375 TaxID=2949571 RepID=A0A926VAB9_9CYAN|nr:DNA sulfur modification protein DndB [Aerosakkonema funiforme]MBD2179703.1 DNA sulfur modification protein DndB [Aerosakkonema funiforme FACHB-1375]